jgi:hypothetical protein
MGKKHVYIRWYRKLSILIAGIALLVWVIDDFRQPSTSAYHAGVMFKMGCVAVALMGLGVGALIKSRE